MQRIVTIGLAALIAATAGMVADAGQLRRGALDPDAVQRLKAENPGAEVALDAVTGAASFVRLDSVRQLGRVGAASQADQELAAATFLDRHGRAFGLRDGSSDLSLQAVLTDRQGETHLTYAQHHDGVPVFGGFLKAHFDAFGQLAVVNGKVVPGIELRTAPSRDARQAAEAALRFVGAVDASVRGSRLVVFREGLAKGVPGDDHLAWEVEVGNGRDVRSFVYVDAHSLKPIDEIVAVYEGLNRRAYDGAGANPGPNYPGNPFWIEGQTFPTGNTEANNMILASGETYDLFFKGFGRDGFDGAGATMDAIFNRGGAGQCPNASWNGTFISFCPGLTTDDVTGHEWGHAYTEYTHGLIYQWQPGALNESYSDIWGEVVDFINGRGGDTPNNPRTAGACTVFTSPPPTVVVNAPPAIAGVKSASSALFGPQSFALTNDVVLANDGVTGGTNTLTDGCCAGLSFVCAPNSWTNAAAVAGKIALVDRGTCGFVVKAKNAQVNGAVGLIVANNAAGLVNMSGFDPSVTIPSVMILQTAGAAIKAQLALPTTVNASMSRPPGTDNSVRWLMGEDVNAPGLVGALRDMWTPPCYGNPGKVTDTQYGCSTADAGGVHNNSGVPNHAFALLVDGGTYNSQTVGAIGLTKAAHIYYRAMRVYQGPASNFADHADAIEQSCSDLIGVNLASLTTGAPSGQVISAADCTQVAKAALAVELRTPPTFCNFQPLLAQNPPPLCTAGKKVKKIFDDDFDSDSDSDSNSDSDSDSDSDKGDNGKRWFASVGGTTPDFTPRKWAIVGNLPDHRGGKAFFGPDPDIGTCFPGGDETAVLHLDSPVIDLKNKPEPAMLTFDHWVATEGGWDGGNLKISVNGGPWQLVQPADFVYNAYNTTLIPAGSGNTNPIAGEPAFSGTDGGAVDGTWGRSIVNLAPYASPNSKIRLRFDLGNDGCSGRFGWYVDDVQVYQCK